MSETAGYTTFSPQSLNYMLRFKPIDREPIKYFGPFDTWQEIHEKIQNIYTSGKRGTFRIVEMKR